MLTSCDGDFQEGRKPRGGGMLDIVLLTYEKTKACFRKYVHRLRGDGWVVKILCLVWSSCRAHLILGEEGMAYSRMVLDNLYNISVMEQ
jgi:hypothetical protein